MAVRTNHAHIVISAPNSEAERVLGALKSNATRVMRTEGCWIEEHTPWSQGGSTGYIWNEKELTKRIDYVVNGQGEALS